MTKYEYKTIAYDTKGVFGGVVDENQFENELNRLGDEGWELVNSVSTNATYGSSRSIVCIFKRSRE